MMVIRDDVIDPEQIITREKNSAVNDDNFVAMFEAVHVFSNFTQTAKGINQSVVFLNFMNIVIGIALQGIRFLRISLSLSLSLSLWRPRKEEAGFVFC